MPLRTDEDVVRLRQAVREQMVSLGFSLIDQTKMVTAASELARNTLRYGGGGEGQVQKITQGMRRGLSLVFTDRGPGIPDIALALRDGYTSGGGMGLGLSGAKRLSDEFELDSTPGEGTTVKIIKWKPY
ncbi:MAG: anti-sigma regulatory factor [Pseudomonadota bacterium]